MVASRAACCKRYAPIRARDTLHAGFALAVAGLSIVLIGWALQQLGSASRGVEVTQLRWGAMPVTVFSPLPSATAADAARVQRPAVVIAHGFAGSQQLMQPFALTLARNGYLAVTFDFPGHGRNPEPLPGSLREHEALLSALLGAIERAVAGTRALPQSDGRVALLGHSMASDLVVRHAQADPAIIATVGVSLVYGGARMQAPRNLLSIYGSLEPAAVQMFGRKLVAAGPAMGKADAAGTSTSAAEAVKPGTTYGRFDDGSARRMVLANGAEHISVLYHSTSQRETLDWMNQSFGRAGTRPADLTPANGATGRAFVDARGPAIGALLAGLVLLAWPMSLALRRALQVAARERRLDLRSHQPRRIGTRDWLVVSLGPAILTPLLLRLMPTNFLPILLGDYLLLHFALYGLLTLAGIAWLAGRGAIDLPAPPMSTRGSLLAALAVLGWATLVIGLPVDRYLFNLWPAEGRGWLIVAMLTGTVVWFCTDEWLTRHPQSPGWAYPFTKACFIGSLTLAVALDLSRLFFLIIIIPAILVMFLVYGLLSRWSFHATGGPWAGAFANACAFAWAIAVTFPAISR